MLKLNKKTFLNSPAVNLNDIQKDVLYVLGVPFEGTVTGRKGTGQAPKVIRRNTDYFQEVYHYIKNSEVFDNGWNQKFYMPDIKVFDLGDVVTADIDELVEDVESITAKIYEKQGFSLLLGGEHTVTIPAFHMFQANYKDVAYVQIDSHMDFGKYSDTYGMLYRGAVSRRISEYLEDDYTRMFWVGLSDYTSAAQIEDLKSKNGNIYSIYDIRVHGIEKVVEDIVQKLSNYKCVYVSLDADVLDPSCFPGVSGPPLYGMSMYELLYLLHGLWNVPVKAFDVVEHAPDLDATGNSSYQIVQLLFKNIFHFI